MKSNSLTASLIFERPSAPVKRKRYLGIVAVGCLLAAGTYWALHWYEARQEQAVTAAKIVPAAKVAATTAATVATVTPAVQAAKQTAVEKAPMTLPAEKLKPAPMVAAPVTTPVTPTVPVVPAASKPIAKPVVATAAPNVIVASRTVTTPTFVEIAHKPLPATVATTESPVHHQQPDEAVSDQDKLSEAAQKAFATMMDFADKYPDIYGFKPGDVFQDVRLGDAIPVYTIDDNASAAYQAGQPVKPLLKTVSHWVFPVLVGGEIRYMVGVNREGKNYVPGRGSKILAVFWNRILDRWSPAAGYHPELIINPRVPGYYFTVPELKKQNITDTAVMNDFHVNLSPADVMLASWQ